MLAEFISIVFADYFRLTLIALCALSALAAALSPLIVLSKKSFVPDALGHLVLPGVSLGVLLSSFFSFDKWLIIAISCFFTGLIGLKGQFFLERKLQLGSDSSTVILLGLFFSAGLILSRLLNLDFDLHAILFGDPLGVQTTQVWILGVVTIIVLSCVFGLRRDISAWLCDKEFAKVSGYRVKTVENFFAVAVTASVLIGIWTVGSLMITAFLTLPQAISKRSRVLHPATFAVAFTLSAIGTSFSVLWNLPLGASCVLVGGIVVIVQSVFAQK